MDSSMRSLRSISADGSPSSLKQIKQVTQVGSYNLWMYYANYSRISQRKGIEMDWLLSILGSADVPRVSWDPTTPHSPLTFLIQSLGNISSSENGKKQYHQFIALLSIWLIGSNIYFQLLTLCNQHRISNQKIALDINSLQQRELEMILLSGWPKG